MTTIQLPGLAGELAQYLDDHSPVASPRMASGGAIALLGAVVGAGWELPLISLYPQQALRRVLPHLQPEDFGATQPIRQSVMLIAPSAFGKGGIIDGVEALLAELVQLRPDAEAIARSLLTMQNMDHMTLAAMELEPEGVRRVGGFVRPSTYDRLQDGSLTLLAESTPDAFDHQLPRWYEESAFYGDCLMIRHHGPRGRKGPNDPAMPPAHLLDRLAALTDIALAGEKTLVEVSDEAVARYRRFHRMDMDTYCDHGQIGMEGHWARQSLQVAAILAVGISPRHPVVTADLFRVASELASEGIRLARDGLTPPRPMSGGEFHPQLHPRS
ncbi:MAG: hypothetical protein ACQER6_09760 [Pseudomonadota bacterium]